MVKWFLQSSTISNCNYATNRTQKWMAIGQNVFISWSTEKNQRRNHVIIKNITPPFLQTYSLFLFFLTVPPYFSLYDVNIEYTILIAHVQWWKKVFVHTYRYLSMNLFFWRSPRFIFAASTLCSRMKVLLYILLYYISYNTIKYMCIYKYFKVLINKNILTVFLNIFNILFQVHLSK